MKATLTIILVCFFSTTLLAQLPDMLHRKPWEDYKKKKLLSDTLRKIFENNNIVTPAPQTQQQYNTPILQPKTSITLLGNNGKGSDIYLQTPDNMLLLKPDSNYVSNMPVLLLKNKARLN